MAKALMGKGLSPSLSRSEKLHESGVNTWFQPKREGYILRFGETMLAR